MPRFIDRLLAAEKVEDGVLSAGLPRDCFDDAGDMHPSTGNEDPQGPRIQRCFRRSTISRSTTSQITSGARRHAMGRRAFPNIAQPYPRVFFEYRLQSHMYDVMFDEADRGWTAAAARSTSARWSLPVPPQLISRPDCRSGGMASSMECRQSQCQVAAIRKPLYPQQLVIADVFWISYKCDARGRRPTARC